jgi:GNAT superfamily N-acetyltransferase
MDDSTLAQLEHENLIAAIALAGAQARGARVERADGLALILTGLPLRLFNQVIVESDEATADSITAAVTIARDRGDAFVVNLRRGTDDRHLPTMGALGLVPIGPHPWMPGMALHPLPRTGSLGPPAGHEIRRVVDAAGVADHIQTAADGFGTPRAWMEAIMSEDVVGTPGASVYVGYTHGEPVTTGLSVRTGRTIGVYNIATIESARGRGYGTAMTRRLVDDGAGEGCDVAILQASDMGKPIYERLSFRTVVEYSGYVDPASVEPAEGA